MRIALAAILLVSQNAHAGGCRAVVQKEVAVAAVVAPVIQAVQIQVPLYSYSYPAPAAYTQQYQQQAVQAEMGGTDCCTALVAELAKLRAEVVNLRAGGAPIGTPGTAPSGAILATKCAACHTAGPNLKGEFAMFAADGKRNPLSLQQKTRARRAILANDMPRPVQGVPHVPLTQEQKDAALKELETP